MKQNERYLLVVAVMLVLAAIVAAYLQLYGSGDILGCFDGGGCDTVQQSEYSAMFGIPVAVIGIFGFIVMGFWVLALYLYSDLPKWNYIVVAGLLGLGSAVALWLIYLQIFVIGEVCKYCMIADSLMIASTAIYILKTKKIFS